ncbi:MAG: ATP-binding protein [Oscillospiraceae bacterium]|nr:ATP-binding protein [Oscillospiraceae bacterium]
MDFEARKVIEALRSGVPSRAIGGYFGSARMDLLAGIADWLNEQTAGGKILTASYGEGKTHLLNTVFGMARSKNMAVSFVSLSRETPFNNLYQTYQKIALNTYLPNREQAGFDDLLDKLDQGKMAELQLYAAKELQTDKLYYLAKAYCNTDDPEAKFSLLADMQGDFIGNTQLKKIYKDIFAEKIAFSVNFVKSRHTWDYILFLNKLFIISGLSGWIILFDEAEHIGRLGRKSRFGAYSNMAKFLNGDNHGPYSLFTMTSNYAMQVIDGKSEREHLANAEGVDKEMIEYALVRIETATELPPLDRHEFQEAINKIVEFHARAYDWKPSSDIGELCEMAWSCGYYLRTKIRAAIEYLDQFFQYGDAGVVVAGELEQETYNEEIPLPDEL